MLASVIKEIDKENHFEIAFSGIAHQKDRNQKDMIDDIKKKKKKKNEKVTQNLLV